MKRALGCLFVFAVFAVTNLSAADQAEDVSRVFPAGQLPQDARLGKPRELRDEYHPWTPPATKKSWEREAEAIRKRVLVSNGLWPMPPRPEPRPIVHGKIERDGYTVEKVILPSAPGHYVTGNLYRPKNLTGKAPAILSPHGHWGNARFYDAGEEDAKN